MTTVYLDSVFFVNALMDYLLFLSAARLAGIALRRGRYLLAGLLGGLYAAAVFLPGLGWLAQAPVKLAVGVLLGLVAFGREACFLRLLLLWGLVSCGMAGCVMAIGFFSGSPVPTVDGIFYTDLDYRRFLVAVTAAYLVLKLVFRASASRGIRGELLPVTLSIFGKEIRFTALFDSGNGLREPGSDRPVLVVEQEVLFRGNDLRTGDAFELFERLREAFPELHPRLLPYHAVGVSGLLVSVQSDWAVIGGRRYAGLRVALSPTRLGNGYAALWGGELGKEGIYERLHGNAAKKAEAAAGLGRRDPLCGRKRRAAAASKPGAGGRAAE